ncbi:MAG: hypothetical protein ABT19_09140 [Rhodanobacter sp. SCN 68-63]|nr:MAG: hypothetical protein ABT19_09140 [Rhodanobacter sp. SCN 68-63]
MHDTIDLLEAIGRDASLRYADGEALAADVAFGTASEALRTAILRGSRAELVAELGTQSMQAMQGTQTPQREEDPDREEDEEPTPDHPDSPEKI